MRILSIAAIQTNPVPNDLEATWARFEAQAESAKKLGPDVDVIVVPELLLSAPGEFLLPDPDGETRSAAPIPSPLTHRISALARRLNVWLVPGSLLETDNGNTYNTAIAVSPQGEIVARYRKLFPWRPFETTTPGDSFVTFDIPGCGRIGLAICFDGSFPEVARQLAWLGAEVIIQPTLTTTRDRAMEIVMSQANAFANQVYVVNVNGASPSGVGESVIVDPEGTIMQHARGGEEILFAVLDLDRVTQLRRYGTHGINRPWAQLRDQEGLLRFPMFGGAHFQSPEWSGGSASARQGSGTRRA
ncbi:carbon-nitrogen hydrolase family protein [Paenarthrobacter nitroguajacolicus]|uniref:carbon-nitrogen hydrolase family protein n=1 Tax=Paenarthrobacter nitroguajacolicus TaxID=211146 RepID=UPI0015BDCCFC|nr:carbon-nitrogen hydrolase family protein [Paenarthrobacter nitroguajacolicus]NWL31844.1 carbon-nitrogen hydrolase family protein [Paenarthrobacter nitroguajacolicus]